MPETEVHLSALLFAHAVEIARNNVSVRDVIDTITAENVSDQMPNVEFELTLLARIAVPPGWSPQPVTYRILMPVDRPGPTNAFPVQKLEPETRFLNLIREVAFTCNVPGDYWVILFVGGQEIGRTVLPIHYRKRRA